MLTHFRISFVLLIVMTVITGLAYPLSIMGLSQLLFPQQANGSLIMKEGKPIGSELIAQGFTADKYFHPRPSAASYNGASSGASNLAPSNPALLKAVSDQAAAYGATAEHPVPVDLVTQSGSGLDPHITPAAAYYQTGRIAKARGLSDADVTKLIQANIEGRTLGFLGEERVNVLKLNLALDAAKP